MITISILIDDQEVQTVNVDSLEKSLNLYLKQLSRQKDRIDNLFNTKAALDGLVTIEGLSEALVHLRNETQQITKLRNTVRKARIESCLREVEIVEE